MLLRLIGYGLVYMAALMSILSCHHGAESSPMPAPLVVHAVKPERAAATVEEGENAADTIKKYTLGRSPVMGYRFVITGDFNGDKRCDTLTECFYSTIEGKETCKYYDSLDYDDLVRVTVWKEPVSFMKSSNQGVDSLFISARGQLLGLLYAKNEGDLDGDGGDEISYIVNWADWSALNTCHLVSFKKGKWKELYAFSTWDWEFPPLPQAQNLYGLFGFKDYRTTAANDTLNAALEQQLKAFEGLITPLKGNRIRIRYEHLGEEHTRVIDMKHIPAGEDD